MTTTIDVVCPRCNMADFVYFRCTTCKYFAIHQPEIPDMVPRRLYCVMSSDTMYHRILARGRPCNHYTHLPDATPAYDEPRTDHGRQPERVDT